MQFRKDLVIGPEGYLRNRRTKTGFLVSYRLLRTVYYGSRQLIAMKHDFSGIKPFHRTNRFTL